MNDQNRSDDVNQSQRSEAVPPDLYAARINGSPETFAKLRQEFELDVGCRGPHVEVNPDGSGTMLVFATEERIRELRAAGYRVELGENVSEIGRQRQKEIGEGDRFMGGRVKPRGFGEKRGRASERRSTS
jgi:hypothetical protein